MCGPWQFLNKFKGPAQQLLSCQSRSLAQAPWSCQLPISSHHGSKEASAGLPPIRHVRAFCPTCLAAKQRKENVPKHSVTKTCRPLQLVHSDLCGPLPCKSMSRARYILMFTDDYTRFTWVYFLRTKAEALSKFKQFKLLVENRWQFKIAGLCTDRGGEYLSKAYNQFCINSGIHHDLTCANTPFQNGVSERKNRTVLEMTRSLLLGSSLPSSLWEEATRAFCLPA